MFYPMNLLKKGGRFYLCWVADSRPVQFAMIEKDDILAQDICNICDDIIEVVRSESGRPTKRFSLRLSSQLMRGLVRIYQRKTTVFLCELCLIEAKILSNINDNDVSITDDRIVIFISTFLGSKLNKDRPKIKKDDKPSTSKRPPKVPRMPLQDEHEAPQRVEDLIQNSGNVVANIQDITLRESAIPEQLLPPMDGFGEENPEQALQLIVGGDRTLEVMLQRDSIAMQHSGLEMPLDVTGRSQDRTRPPHELQMERISEHDITMFGREIPEIPDIPLPDLPVPQMRNLTTEDVASPAPPQAATVEPTTSEELRPTLQIELEDLDEREIQPKRRRVKNKLIIDKRTIIPGDVYRARINDKTVELRCQNSLDDKIDIRLPCDVYFRRPCHVGRRVTSGISCSLTRLFLRNLGPVSKKPLAERSIEQAVQRTREPVERSLVEHIEEIREPALQVVTEISTIPPERISEVDVTKKGFVTGTELRRSVAGEAIDISDLVTQEVGTLSQQSLKRAGDEKEVDNATIKRKRSFGYVSFRQSQQDTEKSVQAKLQEAGLADVQANAEQPVDAADSSRRRETDTSESLLGSLDRTKVSLGDSDMTTDSQKYIREQWGIEGTLMKITKCIRAGETPLTVETLIAKEPFLRGKRKIIAAKCFTSVLKLKQHGFINIKKKINSLEIADITLGPKLLDLLED